MESSGSLRPTHSHTTFPSLEETVIMLDSIDGFALWLRTEGRPKSIGTVNRQLPGCPPAALLRHPAGRYRLGTSHPGPDPGSLAEAYPGAPGRAQAFHGLRAFFKYLELEEAAGPSPLAPMSVPPAQGPARAGAQPPAAGSSHQGGQG
jgi:hypothetical protein